MRPRSLRRAMLAAVASFAAAVGGGAAAQPTAEPGGIAIGFTAALTGPAASFGNALLHGAQLAVARANAAGGVAGRPLRLLVLDDAGEPARAAANTRRLIDQGAVALTGVHGAEAALAVAAALLPPGDSQPRAALVAPATGAEQLRDPVLPGVFHVRAGLAEEAAAAVLHLDTIGVTRYAFVLQSDALGGAARQRLQHELTRIAIRPVAVAELPPNANAVDRRDVLDKVCAAEPEALLLALDAPAAAALVPLAKARHCGGHYLVFSEAGAAFADAPANGAAHPLAGLLVTQVVPHPAQRSHPLIAEYQQALQAQGRTDASYPSVEGYQAVRVIQAVLQACGREASRDCVLRVLRGAALPMPGGPLRFGDAQRVARPFVEITMLDAGGRFRR